MFKIPEGQEVKSFGFSVYDAETGSPLSFQDLMQKADEIEKVESGCHFGLMLMEGGSLAILQNGQFGVFFKAWNKGKFIIQFAIEGAEPFCGYMRY